MPVHDMQQLAERRVRAHTGPHYLLQPGNEIGAPFLAGDLERVGLALPDTERCRPLFESDTLQRRLDVRLCPLERTGTP
jgi:hypothetical protein